jgi:hypothetical protein
VQAHEGKVWARSEVGKGTSFVLRLRRLEERVTGNPSVSSGSSLAVVTTAAAGGSSRG